MPNVKGLGGAVAVGAASNLDTREGAAVREFAAAGHRCLAQLNGETLLALKRIAGELQLLDEHQRQSVMLSASPSGRLVSPKHATKERTIQRTIVELFQQYDSNNDGTLSHSEFKHAMAVLSGWTEDEIDDFTHFADVNSDGCIDIHEFTVWLYSKGRDDSDKQGSIRSEVEALQERLVATEAELAVKKQALSKAEEYFDRELEDCLNFWRSVAKSSSSSTIDKKINLQDSEWLGNGRYGFVLKARRRSDSQQVVVKMLGIRWAHLAIKEWQVSAFLGKHPNIVDYEEVVLHGDDNDIVENMLKIGYEQGKLKSSKKRQVFPDRFICLFEEYMNRGTVQDWMDGNILRPGGMFVVLQKVASALAYMHERGAAHNDVKPENVMLHQQDTERPYSEVLVKLGDLGLAARSADHANDLWQYGMTSVCMVTGARFGARKFRKEDVEDIVKEVATAISEFDGRGRVGGSLAQVPVWLRQVFMERLSMQEHSCSRSLQGWSFFEGDDESAQECNTQKPGKAPACKLKRGYTTEKELGDSLSSAQLAGMRRAVAAMKP
mmetsp:Transcript_137678/g.264379  ORF Transcript_137678/g.264379 Transcript_137678/m.264379 type:complete len:551 (+) Transcript_137678:221-1873(+)